MPIDPDFAEMFPHSVTIEPLAGRNVYNERTYGPAVTWKANIQGRMRLVQTANGDERVSSNTIYIFGSPHVGVEDRITLPNGNQPQILSVATNADDKGDHHTVVYT
jgi:hypothetical protein